MSRGTKIGVTVGVLIILIIGIILVVRSMTSSTATPTVSPTFDDPNATPIGPDADSDNLSDDKELELGTDLGNPDSDGDGYSDGNEFRFGFHPLVKAPYDRLMPFTQNVGYTGQNYSGDDDQDGLLNGDEARWGSNANKADTDDDGYRDGDEVANNHHPSFASPYDKLPENFDPTLRPTSL